MMQLNNPTPDIKDMIFANSFQIISVLVWLEDYLLGILVSNMFCIHPNPGEMIQFDDHIFQMGWSYQLGVLGGSSQ